MSNLIAIAALAIAGAQGPVQEPVSDSAASDAMQKVSRDLRFVPNRGQWDSRAKMLSRSKGLNLWVTSTSLVYDFHVTNRQGPPKDAKTQKGQQEKGTVNGHVVEVAFEGASSLAKPIGTHQRPGKTNFISSAQDANTVNIPRYAGTTIQELYPGIDLMLYQDEQTGGPRYDLVVQPGADLSRIKMRYKGANNLRVMENGEVAFDTSVGTITEKGLAAFEVDAYGRRRQVAARANVANGVLSYEVPNYDEDKTLVIDPVVYSTFIGGSDWESLQAVAVADGSAFVCGYTQTTDFPTTIGSYQRDRFGSYDAFVAKLLPDGSDLEYATYLGGNSTDYCYDIDVDPDGYAYITGLTYSSDFPTKNPYQSNNASGDIFVTKLNTAGTGLVWSTYYGGTGSDYPMAIKLDANRRPVVAGYTYSSDFPLRNAIQNTFGGSADGFILRFTSTGQNVGYATYLGGSSDDILNDVAVDTTNKAVAVGYTYSSDYPVTPGAFQTTFGGNYDVMVSKVDASGGHVFSTFIGGDQSDHAQAVATDAKNHIYIGGYAYSSAFPTSGSFSSNATSGYILKLAAGGTSVPYAKYIGYMYPQAIAVDSLYRPFFAGYGGAYIIPPAGAFQHEFGGLYDGFLGHATSSGSTLLSFTYMGGRDYDYLNDMVMDAAGNCYVAGFTYSMDFPVKNGGFDTVYIPGDPYQGFVAKMRPGPEPVSLDPVTSAIGGNDTTVKVRIPSPAPPGGTTVTLLGGGGVLDLPSSITIPENQTVAAVTVQADGVDSSTVVQIAAKLGPYTTTRRVLVNPAGPIAVTFNPTSVVGGSSKTVVGRVILNGKAGPAGIIVPLTQRHLPSSLAKASVPGTVTITANADRVTFPVTHQATSAPSTMHVTARANGFSATGTLKVKAP